MELREISLDDLPLFESLQCDPVMMAELGGPHPKEKMPQILQNTLRYVETGRGWVYKVVPDGESDKAVGTVSLWESEYQGEPINEIGWMILTAYQGQGLGSRAVRAVLDKARAEGRWNTVHAFPSVANAASNAICRKLGFTQLEECDIEYSGRHLRCNHWRLDLR